MGQRKVGTHSETNKYFNGVVVIEEIGGVFNHAPDSDEAAPSSWDLEISFVQWFRRVSNMCWTTGWSQEFL